MKAYLTIELEIEDYVKTLQYARDWEKQNKYDYGDDTSSLLTDFFLGNGGYNIIDSDLHIVTAHEVLE